MKAKILAAAAFSLMMAGAALAQTSGGTDTSGQASGNSVTGAGPTANTTPSTEGGERPTDFEIGDRAVFVNEQNQMRDETDARARFMAMAPDRQQAIRDRCTAYRDYAQPGSNDLTNTQTTQTDPVPGVFNMATACGWVENY